MNKYDAIESAKAVSNTEKIKVVIQNLDVILFFIFVIHIDSVVCTLTLVLKINSSK